MDDPTGKEKCVKEIFRASDKSMKSKKKKTPLSSNAKGKEGRGFNAHTDAHRHTHTFTQARDETDLRKTQGEH
jgi:hypothetical protein